MCKSSPRAEEHSRREIGVDNGWGGLQVSRIRSRDRVIGVPRKVDKGQITGASG